MRTVQEGVWGRSLTGGLGVRQIVFEGESDGSGEDGGEQEQPEPHSKQNCFYKLIKQRMVARQCLHVTS